MPEYDVVISSATLGEIVRRRFANLPEEALDDFLGEMEPHGVKRLSPTEAVFLDELAIGVRPVDEMQPVAYPSNLNAVGPMRLSNVRVLEAPGRERWRR